MDNWQLSNSFIPSKKGHTGDKQRRQVSINVQDSCQTNRRFSGRKFLRRENVEQNVHLFLGLFMINKPKALDLWGTVSWSFWRQRDISWLWCLLYNIEVRHTLLGNVIWYPGPEHIWHGRSARGLHRMTWLHPVSPVPGNDFYPGND